MREGDALNLVAWGCAFKNGLLCSLPSSFYLPASILCMWWSVQRVLRSDERQWSLRLER